MNSICSGFLLFQALAGLNYQDQHAMKKYVIIPLFAGLVFAKLSAQRPIQEHTPWDVRLTATIGQTLIPSNSSYQITSRPGSLYGGGFQIDYLIKKHYGVGFGFEYHKLNTEVVLSDYAGTSNGVGNLAGDPVQRNYEFRIQNNNTDVVDFIEMSTFDFPIYGYYKIPLKNNTFVDFRGGLLFSFQSKGTFTLQSSDLNTQLYYNNVDVLLTNIPSEGLFDSRTEWHPKRNLNTPILTSTFASAGIDFPFLRVLQLRASAYISYSLSPAYKLKEDALITYPTDYNGVLSLTNNNHIFTYGVKFALGWNKYPKQAPMRTTEYNCAGCSWMKRENALGKRRR